MTTEYSISEMLSFYEKTVKEIATNEPKKSRRQAAKKAKEALRTQFPENIYSDGASLAVTGSFWNKVSNILEKYYPQKITQKSAETQQYRFEAPAGTHEKPANGKKKPFSHIMLELAEVGFIPNLAVFKVFLNGDTPNASSFTAAVSNLKKSNYLTEKNDFGYQVVYVAPKETPEEKAAREAKEQREKELKAMKEQMAALMTRIEMLESDK